MYLIVFNTQCHKLSKIWAKLIDYQQLRFVLASFVGISFIAN